MKKIILILLAVYGLAGAYDAGMVKSTNWINFEIICNDTLGRQDYTPDSMTVTVCKGTLANAAVWSYRNGAAVNGGTSYIDTLVVSGNRKLLFRALFDTLNGDSTYGKYAGNVELWTQGVAWPNQFGFELTKGDGNNLIDTVFALLDSIQRINTAWGIYADSLRTYWTKARIVATDNVMPRSDTSFIAQAAATKLVNRILNGGDSVLIDYLRAANFIDGRPGWIHSGQ